MYTLYGLCLRRMLMAKLDDGRGGRVQNWRICLEVVQKDVACDALVEVKLWSAPVDPALLAAVKQHTTLCADTEPAGGVLTQPSGTEFKATSLRRLRS